MKCEALIRLKQISESNIYAAAVYSLQDDFTAGSYQSWSSHLLLFLGPNCLANAVKIRVQNFFFNSLVKCLKSLLSMNSTSHDQVPFIIMYCYGSSNCATKVSYDI